MNQHYHLFACLPFVELAHQAAIQIGPITFWPASKYQENISLHAHLDFQNYINTIGEVKALANKNHEWVNTIKLNPHSTTCVSINNEIPEKEREALLIDSLYLLYFACSFRNLYYGDEIPPFGPFRKMIPASLEFIQNKSNWESIHIKEIDREETLCIHLPDHEICQAFGKMLNAIYTNSLSSNQIGEFKRIIRAIRYLVDRLFQRFVNLFSKELTFSDAIFEPEDVILLTTGFESLFDINDKNAASDFKHKLRPLLHLKYSRPLEIFWKWIDTFYDLKRNIVHGGNTKDSCFKHNPNFQISHLFIGIKLFIYSVYYMLFKNKLISSKSYDPYTPPDFKWIHPEEVLLLFWTEDSLLKKLENFMNQLLEGKGNHEELKAEIHLLSNLFIALQERFFEQPPRTGVTFIPSSKESLKDSINKILSMLEQPLFSGIISDHLSEHLKARLTNNSTQRR